MTSESPTQSTHPPVDLESLFRSLQVETLVLISLFLGIMSMILVGYGIEHPDLGWCIQAGMVLLLMLGLGFLIQRWSYWTTSSLLVLGCLWVEYTALQYGRLEVIITILFLPVVLATLTLGAPTGIVIAGAATLYLVYLPATSVEIAWSLRLSSIFTIWTTVGLVWLALRPLLKSVEWAWSAYDNSRELLSKARQFQVQLQQALEDSVAVNAQLARLNQLTQNLRQIAENERQTKQEFVANVSHELRTPLNMIIGFCEMILKKPRTYSQRAIPPALLADLEVVLRNSQHLSELIDDVLDLSKIDAGQMALFKERVSLAEIIQAAVTAILPLYSSKGLYLEPDIPDDLPLIYCDRTRIREVLLNLLSNAGRFTFQGGVRVKVQREDSFVTVSVADTGTGISEETREKIFHPFQQADNMIRQRYGGTGLGLSISKNFIELHEGKMWVESQAGVGTTFTFQLPIDPPMPLKGTPSRWLNQYPVLKDRIRIPKPPRLDVKPRIVVVESGSVMQKLVSRYLENYDIVSVPDLDTALADMNVTPAHALLVNTFTNQDTLARLTQTSTLPYSVPAIICSIPGAEQASGTLGVSDYLVKPISRDTLLSALDKLGKPIKTILLVDDEPDALQLFHRMLTSAEHSYRVLRAGNGLQALDVLREESVDVILLDLIMPGMDGFQLLSEKNQLPGLRNIPVILISAKDLTGQPIASNALVVTRGGGLSASQILTCIEALTLVLSPGPPQSYPEFSEKPLD